MFRRPARRESGRSAAWAAFARELELVPGDDLAGRLPDQLGLGQGEIAPVYALTRPGQPRLVLFDQVRERVGPAGRVTGLRSCVLVRSEPEVDFVSLRVTERQGKAMERIEAGRTGSMRLEGTGDDAFDERLGVYARDEAAARRLMTAPVRDALVRILCEGVPRTDEDAPMRGGVAPARGRVAPVVVIGGRNVLLTLEEPEPVALERLAGVTVDMLGLYAALTAARS